jgi:hypothetical protein
VSLEIVNPPREISGIFFLVQQIALELYQTAGSQALDLEAGASLERFLGLLDEEGVTGLRMDLSVIMGQIEERIRSRQAIQRLTSDERLRQLILESVVFDPAEGGTAKVLVRVIAESGRATRIDVGSVVFATEEEEV